MRILRTFFLTILIVVGAAAAGEEAYRIIPLKPVTISDLEDQARKRVDSKARIALEPESSDAFKNLDAILASDIGKAPNYARAVASLPGAPATFTHVFKAYVTEGTIEPETKLAMALQIASLNGSPYTAAHVMRYLRTTDRGQILLEALKSGKLSTLPERDRLAISYADAMTKEIHGLPDAQFQRVRMWYNDAQIVELTMNGAFFNYFSRFVEGLNLPVESWALTAPSPADRKWTPAPSRVALLSDRTIESMNALMVAAKKPAAGSLAHGTVANSLRAMMQSPIIGEAWMAHIRKARESESVSREIKLQISFAVSMVNGCRYCTLHQVQGLRSVGVSPAKLVAMRKDDTALTPRERAAVLFARKLTTEPSGVTDADYQAIRTEFGEKGAIEVLLQTCTFAWFNRFTDGLRLPSEDTAIEVYHETYGGDYSAKR